MPTTPLHAAHASFVAMSIMWLGMMTTMMAPTVWPWIQASHRLGISTPFFASGYFAAWAIYSVIAAALQVSLGPLSPPVAAGILIAAGLFQFAGLKRACLTHCRNPLTYFLARWRSGPAGGFRMGFGHGAYCVGCCWALMATPLALGVMSLWWMAALAVAAWLEQATPLGEKVRVAIGAVLVTAGLRQIIAVL